VIAHFFMLPCGAFLSYRDNRSPARRPSVTPTAPRAPCCCILTAPLHIDRVPGNDRAQVRVAHVGRGNRRGLPSATYYILQARALLSWAHATKDEAKADRLRAQAADELEQAKRAGESADLDPLLSEFNEQSDAEQGWRQARAMKNDE